MDLAKVDGMARVFGQVGKAPAAVAGGTLGPRRAPLASREPITGSGRSREFGRGPARGGRDCRGCTGRGAACRRQSNKKEDPAQAAAAALGEATTRAVLGRRSRRAAEQDKAMGTQATYGQRGRSERSAASHNTERLRCRWLCADNDYPVENILRSFSACFQRSQRPTKRLTDWLVSTRTGYHGRDRNRGLTRTNAHSAVRVGHLGGDF